MTLSVYHLSRTHLELHSLIVLSGQILSSDYLIGIKLSTPKMKVISFSTVAVFFPFYSHHAVPEAGNLNVIIEQDHTLVPSNPPLCANLNSFLFFVCLFFHLVPFFFYHHNSSRAFILSTLHYWNKVIDLLIFAPVSVYTSHQNTSSLFETSVVQVIYRLMSICLTQIIKALYFLYSIYISKFAQYHFPSHTYMPEKLIFLLLIVSAHFVFILTVSVVFPPIIFLLIFYYLTISVSASNVHNTTGISCSWHSSLPIFVYNYF